MDIATSEAGGGSRDEPALASGDDVPASVVLSGTEFDDLLTGGIGDDRIFGRGGDDRLIGGAGADWLEGGSGHDVADYSTSSGAVMVRLWIGYGRWADAEGDLLIGIEGLVGSAFDDALAGDARAQTLHGLGGADLINGYGGDDIISGGAGADRLDGGDGIDTVDYSDSAGAVFVALRAGIGRWADAEGDRLSGFENVTGSDFDDALGGDTGANRFVGGRGADFIDGAEGVDTADYSGSDERVVVRLWAGTGEGGDAEGDRLSRIENLIGSTHDDILGGNSDDNMFEGGLGADLLSGGDGVDTAAYASSSAAVEIRLWAGTASGGDAEGDRFIGIENLSGSAFDDVLAGDAGANRLTGGAGADLLSGNAGDDILDGGGGADWLYGGEGVDTADYSGLRSELFIRLWAGSGDGILVGSSPRYFPSAAEGDRFVSIENVIGGEAHDIIAGDRHDNALSGGGDYDYIKGHQGNDVLRGDAGNDLLFGNDGDDVLDGGLGDDRMEGGAGDDVFVAGEGADRMAGGSGFDTVDFSLSHEPLYIAFNGRTQGSFIEGDTFSSIEAIVASRFDDAVEGDGGGNRLDGGDGADYLWGHGGSDVLVGGVGPDSLDGGSGADDTADYAASDGAVTIFLDLGTGSGGHAEGDTLAAIEHVAGSVFADTIAGSMEENRLFGGSGDDTLYGEGGADNLDGGDGDDRLFGGDGGDVLAGGAGIDTADYADATEAVFVRLWAESGAWGAAGDSLVEIENLAGSMFDDALGGDAGDNTLVGRDGDDLVSGHEGDDRLDGGAGADLFSGGSGYDTADYSHAPGAVMVRLWAGGGNWSDAEGDTYYSMEAVVGSAFADVIAGDASANRLEGGAGDDLLAGHGGDDRLIGGAGNDLFVFDDDPGHDEILDFGVGDRIDFSRVADLNSYEDFAAAAVDEAGGLRIAVGSRELFVHGVTRAAIGADDLIF